MKNYFILTPDPNSVPVTEAEFIESLNTGNYYLYTTETEETLYPYSENYTNYHIDVGNGKIRSFGKAVFFTLLKTEKQRQDFCKEYGQPYIPSFAQYEGDGYFALLPPTEFNLNIAQNAKNAESVSDVQIHRQGRCIDEQGRVCRYIHNVNGKRIQNADGKNIGSRCTECPRAGWIGGNRINCCLCHTCKSDCTYCPNPKESRSDLSTDVFEEIGFEMADPVDYAAVIEDKQLLDTLFAALNGDSAALVKAVHFDNYDIMELARERQPDEPDAKLKTIHQRLLRQYKKALEQMGDILE